MNYLLRILILGLLVCTGLSWPVMPAYAAQTVAGAISSDTTWTKANSPYTVIGNIQVNADVTLTIEPGVVVQFSSGPLSTVGYYIDVQGTLRADGTTTTGVDPILFTSESKDGYWGCIAFTDTSVDWNENTQAGSKVKNCIIEYAGNSQGINNARYGGAAIKCLSAVPLISNNIIRYNAGDGIATGYDSIALPENTVTSHVHHIQNNRIHHSVNGVNIAVNGVKLENNYLINNSRAINFTTNLNTIDVLHNTIINNRSSATANCINLPLYFEQASLIENTISITGNDIENQVEGTVSIAFSESLDNSDYVFSMTDNNIVSADSCTAVFLSGWKHLNPDAMNMHSNWWGTVDLSLIDELLYDFDNDLNLPEIDYSSYAVQAISNAGSTLSYPPMSDAGQDMGAEGGAEVTLDGSGSYDPDGVMAYAWTLVEPENVYLEINNSNQHTATFTAPFVDVNKTYKFRLTVTASDGFVDTDDIIVTLDDQIADAGQDLIVLPDSTVILDGSGTHDPDRLMRYKWTQIDGPAVTLKDADSMQARFIAPYTGEDNTGYTFELSVYNNAGFQSTDEMTVVVTAPEAYERKKSDCFIGTLPGSIHSSSLAFVYPAVSLFILLIGLRRLFRRTFDRASHGYTRQWYLLLLCTMGVMMLLPVSGQCGYFSVGNGGGGDADEYNLSIETGGVRLGSGSFHYLLGGGVFGMFHGYNNVPDNTRDHECPHDDYSVIDDVKEGVESGLYGKAGIGLFDTGVYFSILCGVSMVTEVELVQSKATSLYYEQSSEQTYYGVYGGGIGYFPDWFRWELCLQLDYDNRRGVVGSIGFYW